MSVENGSITLPDGRVFASEIVTLKDSLTQTERKVTMRELDAPDGIIAKRVLNATTPGELLQLEDVEIALSIVEIDGVKVIRPARMPEVMAFLSKFKKRDMARLTRAYRRLNSDVGEEDADD